MGLKIKKFNDILKDMVIWVTSRNERLTNMRVGGVTRTILESVAVEVESLYYEARRGFSYAIENSIYNSFDFRKRPAIPSKDYITILFMSPLTERFFIPKDTQYFTIPVDGEVLYFKSVEDTFAEVGSESLQLLVQCEVAGIKGNVPPFSIRRQVNPSPLIQDIYNEHHFLNGLPEETLEARKKRFSDFIDSLGKGTKGSMEYAFREIEGISGVSIQEDIGRIRIYAHNKSGKLDPDQRTAIQELLPEYKCAGIQAVIMETTLRKVDLELDITLASDYDEYGYMEKVYGSVAGYLNNFSVGKSVTRADLIRFIMNIDENAILNVELNMDSDIEVQPYELVRAGDIAVRILR